MKENEEDWEKQLDTVIIEIAGLNEIFIEAPHYRKTVFEAINLLQEIKNL